MPLFSRPSLHRDPKSRQFLLWIAFFKYVTLVVILVLLDLSAVGDDGHVPVMFIPTCIAFATIFVNSIVSAITLAMVLAGHRAAMVWRAGLALWVAGIAGTVLAAVLVMTRSHEASAPAAVLFAVPLLLFARPPRRDMLRSS